MEDLDNRLQRIQAVFFPDLFDDDILTKSRVNENEETCVEMLAQPAFELRDVLRELVFYSDDAMVTAEAAPELIPLLRHSNPAVAAKATGIVYEMSRKPAQRAGLTENEELVKALVAELKTPTRHEEYGKLVMTIRNLSKTPRGVEMLYQARTIPELVALLGHQNVKYVTFALDTLHALIRHQPPAKQQVRLCGGVEKMVDLMARTENELNHAQSMLFDCLNCLAYHSVETKGIVLSMGGTNQLLKIIATAAKQKQADKKLVTAAKLLKVLSIDDQNKAEIIDSYGVDIIDPLLDMPHTELDMLWALRNLSDKVAEAETPVDAANLIGQCIKRLSSHDVNVIICCAGILSNLTCNNTRNKQLFVQLGGVEKMVRTVHRVSEGDIGLRDEIVVPGLTALRHVTRERSIEDKEWAEEARKKSQTLIPSAIQLLESSSWSAVKATVGFIRNMANQKRNRTYLRDQDAIPNLVKLLITVLQKLVNADNGENHEDDQVDMVDVAEGCTGALQNMAKDSKSRQAIRAMDVLPSICDLLCVENVNLQRSSAGLLCEMSVDKASLESIYKANEDLIVQNELLALLESESDATVVYASIVLTQLNRYTAEKENRHAEIAEINKRMMNIIANKVGEDNYDTYQQDQFFNYHYEGTIRRPQMDESLPVSASRAESRASDLSYQHGHTSAAKSSLNASVNDEAASLITLPTPPSSSFKRERTSAEQFEQMQITQRDKPDFGLV